MSEKTRSDYIMTLQAPFYSAEEAALILGFSKKTIYRKIDEGKLKASKIGKSFIITKESLISFVESAATKN